MQALRSKYFLVGQNLNTNAQSTSVSRPAQPVAQLPQNNRSNAAQQQRQQNSQKHDGVKLSIAGYKNSTSTQLGHAVNDVSSSNVRTRQPTPGPGESMALFDTSLDNFQQTAKSNLAAHTTGSKSDLEMSAAVEQLDLNHRGLFRNSKPDKENKMESIHDYDNKSKFPPTGLRPLWQTESAITKQPQERKRTLYNPAVAGAGRTHNPNNKIHSSAAVGEGESNPSQWPWGRTKRDSINIEGLLADVSPIGAGSKRKPQERYYVLFMNEQMLMCPSLFRFEATVSGSKGPRSRHVSKVEPSDYYMSQARYSPLSSGKSKGNSGGRNSGKIAFGSGVPRWPQGM